ncbi:MAG: hypothetical protein HKN23_13605 [Verrucomicrobiales bacterium]|nr:hypothetical protein [Verrucomicrobiales bacterium]
MLRAYGAVYRINGTQFRVTRRTAVKTRSKGQPALHHEAPSTRLAAPKSACDKQLAAALLGHFWDGNFRDDPIGELIDLDRDLFIEGGTPLLLGEAGSDPLFRAWWTIRMGLPQTRDPNHQFLVVNLHRDDGELNAGHLAIGIRKIGGDPQGDFILDPRAPWFLDRRATMIEAANVKNKLTNGLFPFNLYDWLYTQAEYRECLNHMWFTPISREQVRILRHVTSRDPLIAGPFKPFHNNCASLAKATVSRILPFDQPIGREFTIADFPIKDGAHIVERFGGEITFVHLSSRQKPGRKPTSKSEIHPAPNRAETPDFQALKKVPEINR